MVTAPHRMVRQPGPLAVRDKLVRLTTYQAPEAATDRNPSHTTVVFDLQ
jgi:hypothetical protein